jgi:hypothetical protein
MKTLIKQNGYLVIDGMHRVTSVNNLLGTGTLLVTDGDHMVRSIKAPPENV